MSTRPADPASSGNSTPSGTIQRSACGDCSDSTQRRWCAFADEQLHALAGLRHASRSSTGSASAASGKRSVRRPTERRQLGAEIEAAVAVTPQQPVLLERDRQAVGRGTRQIGGLLQFGQGPRLGGDGAQHGNRLVEHADTRYDVHTARSLSQKVGMSKIESPMTLPEKIWYRHLVRRADGEPDLLYIDLHLVHEVTSPQAFDGLRLSGRRVRRPDLTVATEDHNVPTADIHLPIADEISAKQVETLRRNIGRVRCHQLPDGRPEPGHRARDRTRAGPHAARHDDRVRRQPHRDPRRVRGAGVRDRHQRGRARAGHADAAAVAAEVDVGHRRR